MLKIDLNSLIGLKVFNGLITTVMLAISVLILTVLSPIVAENLAAPNTQATGVLRGQVLDVADSNPIPDALIELLFTPNV